MKLFDLFEVGDESETHHNNPIFVSLLQGRRLRTTGDLPGAHIHIIDGSHMVLETNFDEVLDFIANFLSVKSA